MIEGLTPYPDYVETGLPWLPRVPRTWRIARNGSLFSQRNQPGSAELPILEVSLRSGVRVRNFENGARKQVMSDLTKYKRAEAQDLAYNTMRLWQGAVGTVPTAGLVSPAYVVARPHPGVATSFYSYLFRTDFYKHEIDAYSRGIVKDRNRLYWDQFKQMPSPVPPTEEQEAIVRFLGHANRRIEYYICAKRKLIALLHEQKQAIIHRAVTRGLDPNAHLKDSGLPWLGEIPAHWKTPMMARCIKRIDQGWSPVAAEGDLELNQWAVLSLSSVRRGRFRPSAVKPISHTAEIPRNIEVRDGDFLLTRSNNRERVGDVCIVEGASRLLKNSKTGFQRRRKSFVFNPDIGRKVGQNALFQQPARPRTILCDLMYRLSLREELVMPRFVVYQLLGKFGRTQIERDARGSSGTMPKISQGHIKS
jgi:type I restriction enzyme S subunit